MQSLPDSLDQLAIFTRYRQQVLTCNFHDMQHASSFNTILKGLFHVVHCILDKESIFFAKYLQYCLLLPNIIFGQNFARKGLSRIFGYEIKKRKAFCAKKEKKKRGWSMSLAMGSSISSAQAPTPPEGRLPNHYSFRKSEGGWCRLCWFILFLSKKTHYFRSVKFLLALKK